MIDYLFMLIAVILMAGSFVTQKAFQNRIGNTADANFKFNAFCGIFRVLIFVLIAGIQQDFKFNFSWFSVILATITALVGFAYLLLSFPMLKSGQMATYTLFLMTGGSMIPYVWGLFKLGEEFSILRTFGLVLIIGGVFFANFQRTSINKKYILMGVGVFIFNGIMSTVAKIHQVEKGYETVSSSEFIVFQSIAFFVFGTASWIIWALMNRDGVARLAKRSTAEKRETTFWMLFWCFMTAIVGGVSYIFQLTSAENLPATVVYPFLTGGSIIFTALAGLLFFREKISKKVLVGIVLCFVGTLMFL